MDIYIIIVGFIIIVLLLLMFFKRNNNKELNDLITKAQIELIKEIGDFKLDFSDKLNKDFNIFSDRMDKKIEGLNNKVNEHLSEGFEKTNKTFQNVLERLAKIDEAQKKIDGLSSDIVSLEGILTDKKSRGIFGEVNLYHILSAVFGEKNDKVYRMQVKLSNDSIADSVVYAPQPLGTICIDSKFPLENYRRLVEKGLSNLEKEKRSKDFQNDVKKHIDAIADKYIIEGETSNQAILFLPAEAVFAELNAYHDQVIKYAASKNIWLASPTTLMSLLTIIQSVLKGLERDKYTSIIHEELNKLGVEFNRYKERWDKLSRSINTVSKDVDEIHTTTDKITKRFEKISNVNLDNKDNKKVISD